ncbi:MAG: alpha/beta fold hydrolase [Acetobacteraceae bacterium]|jgi:pimeloyl-ACP methyl ester carboxylesterase
MQQLTTEAVHDAWEKLDPREAHFRIPGPLAGLRLFLRHLPPAVPAEGPPKIALYVHGGTFPSALSIAHRFDGESWRDTLCAAGFHTWGLDFHGFGALSDGYPEMADPADAHAPLGRVDSASQQLETAVRFICNYHRAPQISLIAHSWGTMVAGHLAGRCPALIHRMVFFGAIASRPARPADTQLPAWRLISLRDQWDRFVADVPAGAPAVLSRRHFDAWGERYLDADPASRTRSPPAVKTPCGAFQDIFDAWAGRLAYDPGLVRAPVILIRGAWDSYCTDADALWLFEALTASPLRRDVKIARATHLLHLEENRYALYREAQAFLEGGDRPPR